MTDHSNGVRRVRARHEANRPPSPRIELLGDRDLAEFLDRVVVELVGRERRELGHLSTADLLRWIDRAEAEIRRR